MDRLEPVPAGPDDAARPGGPADEETTVRFTRFVEDHWSALIAIGIAVSGSRQEAEDLVQNALAGAYPRWDTLRPDDALAYLRRSIVNGQCQPVAAPTSHLVAVAGCTRTAPVTTAPPSTEDPPDPDAIGTRVTAAGSGPSRGSCATSATCPITTSPRPSASAEGTVRSQALRALTALRAAAERGSDEKERS